MNNPRLAGRYAKSLIDLAAELNQMDVVYDDMKFLQRICKSNPDFVALLKSPVIKPGTKEKIIQSITAVRVNAITNSFITLLVRKERETYLPEIVNAFIGQYNKIKNIHQLKLTTAYPISEELKNSIVSKVTSTAGFGNIEIETLVEEELIGGFKIEVEGTLIDASILKDLNDIKKQFMNNEYIHKLR